MTESWRAAVTREGIVAELRRLADLAEAAGDRAVAVRALKLASRIERSCPPHPVPPSQEYQLELARLERGNATIH